MNKKDIKKYQWICLDCYEKLCNQLGIEEILTYTITNFTRHKCEKCDNQAEYLIDDIEIL